MCAGYTPSKSATTCGDRSSSRSTSHERPSRERRYASRCCLAIRFPSISCSLYMADRYRCTCLSRCSRKLRRHLGHPPLGRVVDAPAEERHVQLRAVAVAHVLHFEGTRRKRGARDDRETRLRTQGRHARPRATCCSPPATPNVAHASRAQAWWPFPTTDRLRLRPRLATLSSPPFHADPFALMAVLSSLKSYTTMRPSRRPSWLGACWRGGWRRLISAASALVRETQARSRTRCGPRVRAAPR